jgi:hypothetical protein
MSCIRAMSSSNVSRHADCLSSLTFFGFVQSLQAKTGAVSPGWLRPLLVYFVIKTSALFQAFDCDYTNGALIHTAKFTLERAMKAERG